VKYPQDDFFNTVYLLIIFAVWPILPSTKIVNEVQGVGLGSWSAFLKLFDLLLCCLWVGFV